VQRARRAIPPRSGMETCRSLRRSRPRMGYRFKMKYSTDESSRRSDACDRLSTAALQ